MPSELAEHLRGALEIARNDGLVRTVKRIRGQLSAGLATGYSAAGVVVDVFHVWWDPEVMQQIERARGRIAGFHVSDWPVPLPGILMGRAMMGDGVIELRKLRQAVDATGYDGPIEVEIFNEEIWNTADDGLLERIQQAFIEHL